MNTQQTVPTINGQDLMTDSAFYKWLEKQPRQEVTHFVKSIRNYQSRPTGKCQQAMEHKCIFQCFWRNLLKP